MNKKAIEDLTCYECDIPFDLIMSIVNKGHSETVIEAAKNAGAEGGTIMGGRGTGIHEKAKLFGISIEPEKEVVLNLVPREIVNKVLHSIVENTGLNKPGKGIAFVLEVERTAGIYHLIKNKIEGHKEDSN